MIIDPLIICAQISSGYGIEIANGWLDSGFRLEFGQRRAGSNAKVGGRAYFGQRFGGWPFVLGNQELLKDFYIGATAA